jgi:hypothetical protein
MAFDVGVSKEEEVKTYPLVLEVIQVVCSYLPQPIVAILFC